MTIFCVAGSLAVFSNSCNLIGFMQYHLDSYFTHFAQKQKRGGLQLEAASSFLWKQKRTVQVVNACAVLFFVVTNLEFVVSPQVKELSPIRSSEVILALCLLC